MAIFFNKDVRELVQNKKVVVIGDSIQRSVYKDLVCLWTQENSRYLFQRELRAKGELTFLGDKLLRGGKLEGKMVNGVGYREVREFSDSEVSFKYYFVTRCYSEHMASILNELKTCQPDIIVMNSTFWDLHHYGDKDLQQYKENLDKLLKDITEMFSSSLLFIWNAALPLADRCKGGFLRQGFLTIPVDKIMKANKFAWMATTDQKKIYLDLFTELKNRENFKQAEDGIHWGMRAHRKISNLILTEVCTSWNKKIPDPPQVPNRPDNRNSSPVPWSSYYPDNGETDNYWNSPSSVSYNEGYDYYWDSPSPVYDRYQTPSPPFPSPYGNSWGSLGWGYNLPFFAGREREYQPVHRSVPYQFPGRYPPIQEMHFNFNTPQFSYYPGTYYFKPAHYSDPLPNRSFSPLINNQHFRSLPGKSGLLPTPPGPPSIAFFNEGSSGYRDRFKKLSNPNVRGRRYKSSTTTNPGTPLNTTQNSRPTETPQKSVSTDHKASSALAVSADFSDLNNNKEQKSSLGETCSKANGDNVVVETGLPSAHIPKSPTNSSSPGGSSDAVPTMNGEDANERNDGAQQEGPLEEHAKTCGIKRKHEDDEVVSVEESNPCKIAREESTITDASRSGMKRKLDQDNGPVSVEEPNAVKDVRENGFPCDDAADRCGVKRRRADDDVLEEANPCQIVQAESSSTDNTKDNLGENLFAQGPDTSATLDKGTGLDVVRCALTYDSFI